MNRKRPHWSTNYIHRDPGKGIHTRPPPVFKRIERKRRGVMISKERIYTINFVQDRRETDCEPPNSAFGF